MWDFPILFKAIRVVIILLKNPQCIGIVSEFFLVRIFTLLKQGDTTPSSKQGIWTRILMEILTPTLGTQYP